MTDALAQNYRPTTATFTDIVTPTSNIHHKAPSSPSRPRSPQLPASRPRSPSPGELRSSSPFRPRHQSRTPILPLRLLFPPTTSILGAQPQPLIIPGPVSTLDADLLVVRRPGNIVWIGKPFTFVLGLSIAATIPRYRRRRVRFVVQHPMPGRTSTQSMSETPVASSSTPSRTSSYVSARMNLTQAPSRCTCHVRRSHALRLLAHNFPMTPLTAASLRVRESTRARKWTAVRVSDRGSHPL